MDETIKLKPGEQLILTVPKKSSGARGRGPGVGKRRGPLDRRDSGNKYLPRRARKSGINFYDLGQIKSGDDWLDIDFEVLPSTSLAGSIALMGSMSSTDFNNLKALIFSVDPADWESNYRKLEYEEAERYGLDVVDTLASAIYPVARNGSRLNYLGAPVVDTKWTSKGLNLPGPISLFKMKSYGAFNSFTNASSEYKVTLLPDPSATEVSFPSLAKDATVFLAPRMVNLFGISESEVFSGRQEMLYGKYRAYQRSWWLDRVDSSYVYPLLSFNEVNLEPANQTSLLAMAKEDANEYFWNGTTNTAGSPASFPIYLPYGNGNALYIDHQQFNLTHMHSPAPGKNTVGAFAGAIKQGGVFYFFWAKALSFGDFSDRLVDVRDA